MGDGTCGGGFCCKSGACVAGNMLATCGFSGACDDCTVSMAGKRCVQRMGGPWTCGCEAKEDCPAADPAMNVPGKTCDTAKKVCTTTCGAGTYSACNGGCCSGPMGQCRGGGQNAACGRNGGFCNTCDLTCNPGPRCDPMTGACGCTQLSDCFFHTACTAGDSSHEACSPKRKVCCIPSWFNGNRWNDDGDPKNCCTGMSANGLCTCLAVGEATDDEAKCCSQHDENGACACLPNNAKCLIEADTNGECCSGVCREVGAQDYRCIASPKGMPCQNDSGCSPGLRCVNNVCA
jgi:hypothetical protein